jgi:hypothetical protein
MLSAMAGASGAGMAQLLKTAGGLDDADIVGKPIDVMHARQPAAIAPRSGHYCDNRRGDDHRQPYGQGAQLVP